MLGWKSAESTPKIVSSKDRSKNCLKNEWILWKLQFNLGNKYKTKFILQVGENIVQRAQDELVKAGICVIQNVKLTNLERIARLFGAQILPNLASLVSIPTLGLCEKFHNVFYEQQQKNLVYLEGIN